MSLRKKILFTLILLILSINYLFSSNIVCTIPYEPGIILIQFIREVTNQECDDFALKYSQFELEFRNYPISIRGEIDGEFVVAHTFGAVTFNDSLLTVQELIEILDQDPLVNYCTPNHQFSPRSSGHDPLYHNQWALRNTGNNDVFTRFNTKGKFGADISMERAWNFIWHCFQKPISTCSCDT